MKAYKIYLSIEEYDEDADEYSEPRELELPITFGDIETAMDVMGRMFDAALDVEKER